MKKVLPNATLLLVIAVALAMGQDSGVSQQLAQLRNDVANHSLRLRDLEHASGVPHAPAPAAGATDASSEAPPRTMVLVSIHETTDENNAAEIERLKKETSALQATVDAAHDEYARDFGTAVDTTHVRGGVRGWRGGIGGGRTVIRNPRREEIADTMVAHRYATERHIKQQQLDRLQAAGADKKQILVGHDGNTIITLESKRNISDSLDDISIGDTITWTGTRVNADDGSESWRVSKVEKAGS